MNDGRSWWDKGLPRLYERVRARGYDSLTAFADERPTLPLAALAEELGGEDVSAVHLFSGLLVEAERSHQVTRLVRGQFVRELAEILPNGWPAELDDDARFAIGKARGLWIAFTPETHQERARQVMAALRATPPPPGWLPLGPDDELLRTLLSDEET